MTSRQDPLHEFLTGEIRSGAMPGAAWWVGDARSVLSHGSAGDAVITPFTERARVDTPYDLASLTKPLATALLLLGLQEEKRVSLDAPLGDWLSPLSGTPYAGATVRDAATHRARFPAWGPLYVAAGSRAAYVAAIAATPPGPPRATVYSDLGYVLLGFLVESAGGAPLSAQFEARVAQPLALARCGFAGSGSAFADAAATERGNAYERRLAGDAGIAYTFRRTLIRGHVHDGNAWAIGGDAGHAGLFGTSADVAAIARAILDPVLLRLQPEALAPMLRPEIVEPGRRTFGFLRAADAESVRGVLPDDSVGHFGFTGTSIWIDPSRPRIYVLLTNRVHPDVPGVEFTRTRRGFHERAAAL